MASFKYSELKNQVGDHILGQVLDQKAMQDKALAGIKHRLAVVSGKGGVGKSAVTAGLAKALARLGASVAVLDADLNGPSQGAMLKPKIKATKAPSGLTPAQAGSVALMSMDAFLDAPDQALTWANEGGLAEDSFVWRGLQEARALQSMLRDTLWGERDILLVDLPPGTDRIDEFLHILPEVDGLIVVGVPSPVASQVVARSLSLCKQLGVGVVGLLENMARVSCPHCQKESPLFHFGGGLQELADQYDVPFLGSVPFEAAFSNLLDNGGDPFENPGHAAHALMATAVALHEVLIQRRLPE